MKIAFGVIDDHAAAAQQCGSTQKPGETPALFGFQNHGYRFFLFN